MVGLTLAGFYSHVGFSFDLSPLTKTNGAYKVETEKYEFYINVCGAVSASACQPDSGACKVSKRQVTLSRFPWVSGANESVCGLQTSLLPDAETLPRPGPKPGGEVGVQLPREGAGQARISTGPRFRLCACVSPLRVPLVQMKGIVPAALRADLGPASGLGLPSSLPLPSDWPWVPGTPAPCTARYPSFSITASRHRRASGLCIFSQRRLFV